MSNNPKPLTVRDLVNLLAKLDHTQPVFSWDDDRVGWVPVAGVEELMTVDGAKFVGVVKWANSRHGISQPQRRSKRSASENMESDSEKESKKKKSDKQTTQKDEKK